MFSAVGLAGRRPLSLSLHVRHNGRLDASVDHRLLAPAGR